MAVVAGEPLAAEVVLAVHEQAAVDAVVDAAESSKQVRTGSPSTRRQEDPK